MTSSTLPKDYVIKKFYEYGYGVEYQRSNDTYHCSCPICLEGKSFGKKKRCWYIPAKDLIYCHNCGWSSRPLKWIMQAGAHVPEEFMPKHSKIDAAIEKGIDEVLKDDNNVG